MFRHGYIFQTMLADVGPLNDGRVHRHGTMRLIYGVNRPFRIRLDGSWHQARLCLLKEGVPHYISGDGDWQISYYVYPDSHTGHLLQSAVLRSAGASFMSQEENPARLDTVQPAVRPLPAEEIRSLLDSFIYLLTGKKGVPRQESPWLKNMIAAVRGWGDETELSLTDLARYLNEEPGDMADRFKRITEFPMESWLLHHRMMRFFGNLERLDYIPAEDELDGLIRKAGIAGTTGLDRIFGDLFGLNRSKWINGNPGTIIQTNEVPFFPYYM